MSLLSVQNLKKYFPIRKGLLSRVVAQVKAVDDVSFDIQPRETLGLVGESGCGKTTVGRTILRLLDPTAGRALFKGKDIFHMGSGELRALRKNIQIIFQDPYASLNPRMTVGAIIGEGLHVHQIYTRNERKKKIQELLDTCGLNPNHINRYPHEFSGGQRQRIGIARALALNPDFIVCDEAVSALDVSIQAQVINLLARLREDFDLSYLFIAHDLSVVRHISDRVAVMYLGKIVEIGDKVDMYESPQHPYTRALMAAIPIEMPSQRRERPVLEGDVPSPINPPSGCSFHPRCPYATELCSVETPLLKERGKNHYAACHHIDKVLEEEEAAAAS